MRRMLISSCYISRGMAVLERFQSASDLQGHSRAFALVQFDRPYTISYLSSIATTSLSCIVSEILLLISQHLKRSRDSEHILLGINIMHALVTPVHQSAHEI